MSEKRPHRFPPFAALVASVLVVALLGCQSRRQNEMYQQRMVSEVRILEDQLYEADYRNRVLLDKLEQAEIKSTEIQIHAASPAQGGSNRDSNSRSSTSDRSPYGASDSGSSTDIDVLMPPEFDEGEAVDADGLNDPAHRDGDHADEPPASALDDPPSIRALPPVIPPVLPNDLQALPSDSVPSSDAKLAPAPGGPEPPGKEDTMVPPVVPGELTPPAGDGENDDAKPPGQIQLPDSVNAADRIPDTLRIHQGLSGGHRVDGHLKEMTIVVNVVNKLGKTISMEDFNVDAALSVVILDPRREPSEARIGRWNFTAEEVVALIQTDPISGFHIPITWQDFEPKGDEVIVHVRLRAEEDEMRCEGTIKVEKQSAIAEWTPRGEPLR